MEHIIYTYGNSDVLRGIFNALAMTINGQTGTLTTPLMHMAFLAGVVWMVLKLSWGEVLPVVRHWLMPTLILLYTAFIPTTSVHIKDIFINKPPIKVDNVPYGLAAIASLFSQIGYGITQAVELTFRTADDFSYQKTGMLFGAQLVQKANTLRITHPDFQENIRRFTSSCLISDVSAGKYSMEALNNSADLWQLISKQPSELRGFYWEDIPAPGKSKAEAKWVTCKKSMGEFEKHWPRMIKDSAQHAGIGLFGLGSRIDPRREFLQHLPIAYQTLAGFSKSAENLLKQQLSINAFEDSILQGDPILFAARRAKMQQRNTYEVLGANAGDALLSIRAVLEALAYAAFLFIVPFGLLPHGYQFLFRWCQLVLWLQLWPPFYAILNYIMTLAAAAKTKAVVGLSNSAGVTIASAAGLSELHADISATAGYLMWSVPMISLVIVRGVNAFVSAAMSSGAIGQSAGSVAAAEATTGNYSFGNITQGELRIANTNMFQFRDSVEVNSGYTTLNDGHTRNTVSADGTQTTHIEQSDIGVRFGFSNIKSKDFEARASSETRVGQEFNERARRHRSDAEQISTQVAVHTAQQRQSMSGQQLQDSVDQTRGLTKRTAMQHQFAEKHGLTSTQSENLWASLQGGLVASGGWKYGTSGVSEEVYNKAQEVFQSKEYQAADQLSHQEIKSMAESASDERTRQLAQSVDRSWQASDEASKEASKHFSQAQQYSEQATLAQRDATTIDQNMTQEFIEYLTKQPLNGQAGTHLGHDEAVQIARTPGQVRADHLHDFLKSKGIEQPKVGQDHTTSDLLSSSTSGKQLHQQYQHTQVPGASEVNPMKAMQKQEALKAHAIEQGITGPKDFGLHASYEAKKLQTEQTLQFGEQKSNQDFSQAEIKHEKEAQKTLTERALMPVANNALQTVSQMGSAALNTAKTLGETAFMGVQGLANTAKTVANLGVSAAHYIGKNMPNAVLDHTDTTKLQQAIQPNIEKNKDENKQ